MDTFIFVYLLSILSFLNFFWKILSLSVSFLLHICIKIIEIISCQQEINCMQPVCVWFLIGFFFFWATDNLFIVKGITCFNYCTIHILIHNIYIVILLLIFICILSMAVYIYLPWLVCFKSWFVNNNQVLSN